MTRRWLIRAWPFAIVAFFGGCAVLMRLLSQFNPVDDEGFALIWLTEFLRGGHLYDQVFSPYGPFYHEVYGALFSIPGIKPTHSAGRVILAVQYVVMATATGLFVNYLTKDRLLGVGAQIVTFGVLFQIVREPTLPLALTTLLVLLIMGVALWCGPARTIAITLGCLAAALTLVKINMGVPAGAAVVVAALITFAPQRHRTAIVVGSGLLLTAIVLGITASKIGVGWVRLMFVFEVAGMLAVLARAFPLKQPNDAPALGRWLVIFFVGATTTALAICAIIVALGTSVSGLIDGVITAPSRHPADQSSDLMLRWWVVPIAVVTIALCIAAARGQTKRVSSETRAVGRLAAGAAIWIAITASAPGGVDPGTYRLIPGVLLGWIAIAPPNEVAPERDALSFGRLAAVLTAVVSVMQAYPIGFSRVESAGVPFVIVGALLLNDGLRQLRAARAEAPKERRAALEALGIAVPAALVAMIAVATLAQPGLTAARAYKAGRKVNLPGMSLMRLPNPTATSYEQLAAATHGCDPLVVIPAFYSIYPWSRLRPPNGQNASGWPLLLKSERQQKVVDAIRDKPKLCLLANYQAEMVLIDYSKAGKVPDRPLYRFLSQTRFVPVMSIDVHEPGGQFTLLRRTADAQQGTVGGGLEPIN